jgi:glycosyltransferase involved in cell wall biosynthesis
MSTKVSIITVVFNGEKHLEKAINSVLDQTYNNIEYIVIDGGSTDATLNIIKKYDDQIDFWTSAKDEGIYDAMNKGVAISTGDIIGMVNADDYLYRDTVKIISEELKNPSISYVYGSIHLANECGDVFGESNPATQKNIQLNKYKEMPFSHPSVFVKKSVYDQIGLFNIKFKYSADYDFILRMIEADYKGREVDKHTGVFRMGGVSGGWSTIFDNYMVLSSRGIPRFIIYRRLLSSLTKLLIRSTLPSYVVELLRRIQKNERHIKY